MKVVALDIASCTGWATWIGGETGGEYGSVKFIGTMGDKAAAFSDWLNGIIGKYEITDLAVEPPVPIHGATNIDTTVWLQGCYLRVHEIVARRRLNLWPVAEVTWRSHFLGVTRAPKTITDKNKRRVWLKRRCVDECRARGYEPKNDNAADALAILDTIRCRLDPDYAVLSMPLLRAA